VNYTYPSHLLQRAIVHSYSKCVSFEPNYANFDFDRKIVSVNGFLPESVFGILRNVAERQVQSERVHIPVHKSGATISYHALHYSAPELIAFYLSPSLHAWCSGIVGESLEPTPLHDLSSCSLLIYDRPNDHIGWHFDLNFYRGRHFTALLALVNSDADGSGVSSANLLVRQNGYDRVIPTPPNTLVLFEGAETYHCVTPLREDERRIILSMTFCTDPSASAVQRFERRVKDIAYFGLRALWT
jgi:2OG-Fe(II) oxygenase superfamily